MTVLFPTEVRSFDFKVENSGWTVQYKLNAQSLSLFGLHSDVNDAHRAGANRLQNKHTTHTTHNTHNTHNKHTTHHTHNTQHTHHTQHTQHTHHAQHKTHHPPTRGDREPPGVSTLGAPLPPPSPEEPLRRGGAQGRSGSTSQLLQLWGPGLKNPGLHHPKNWSSVRTGGIRGCRVHRGTSVRVGGPERWKRKREA